MKTAKKLTGLSLSWSVFNLSTTCIQVRKVTVGN